MFKDYNHLGFFNPYYHKEKFDKIITFRNFNEAATHSRNELEIDFVAIAEILSKNYMLGDRTIIKGIKRTPWFAKPDNENAEWEFFKPIQHEEQVIDETIITDKLFEILCKEISSYVTGKKKIGVLLSGGMDSRMVAGALDYLIKTKKIEVESVTGYTWGISDSRDVIYASEIASRLKWKWKHYIVTTDDLWENIKIAGYRGCEYSGIHLHAIPQIANDLDVDVLLAGSFGDSIGRAEYSGIHVENLQPIHKNYINFAWLLNNKTFKQSKIGVLNDLNFYHQIFNEEKKYQQYELDYQLHYMRRMLNPCLELLNERVPTFQAFTNPEIYQYMWSIHPAKRNNSIYKMLMEKFYTKLDDIPWARTGLVYDKTEGIPDNFLKSHHNYPNQIQIDLILKIKEILLTKLNLFPDIFNKNSIKKLLILIEENKGCNFDYLERITWLVSFIFLMEQYHIKITNTNDSSILDKLNSKIKLPVYYRLKHVYRKKI